MPAIGFKREFKEDLHFGIKCQTIRAWRKKGNPKVGDNLKLYIGMRTPQCELIREARCIAVTPITILWNRSIFLDGVGLSQKEAQLLALADGFVSLRAFMEFFKKTYGHKKDNEIGFEGCLIEWEKPK